MLIKSSDVNKYQIRLKAVACGAAPIGRTVEEQLRVKFPGVRVRQSKL